MDWFRAFVAWRNSRNVDHDKVLCDAFLAAKQLAVRNKFQPSPSQTVLQISGCVTYGSSSDSGLGSKVTVLSLWKKFSGTQRFSQPCQKRTSRGASSNGRTTRASVCVCKSSTLGLTSLVVVLILSTT